jgi:mRNA interferase RelE/StbE
MERVLIQWTETAKQGLASLPKKVRRGLLDKANELRRVSDPASVHKPLIGPLAGLHTIKYARYRAIYKVEKTKLPGGQVQERIVVMFVAAGIRKEGDKSDVYRLATRLVAMGLIDIPMDPKPGRPATGKYK